MKQIAQSSRLWSIPMLVYATFILTGVSLPTWAQERTNEEVLLKSLSFVPPDLLLAGMGLHSMPGAPSKEGIYPLTGWIHLWSRSDGRLQHTISFAKNERPQHFDVSPDGVRVAVVFYEPLSKDKRPHGLGCYSLAEKKWLWKWKWLKEEIDGAPLAVKFLPDGRSILVLGLRSIWYYDSKTGQKVHGWKMLLRDYKVWTYALRTCYLSPTGRFLVIWQEMPWERIPLGGVNKYVTVWDLNTGMEISRWEKPEYECQIATFSPDEESVFFGCKDGHVRQWSIKSRNLTRELMTSADVFSVAFSPDSRFLAVNAGIEDVFVVDYTRQKQIHQFDSPGRNYSLTGGKQYPMVFSRDGGYFALWDKSRICLYATSNWEQKWCVVPKPPDVPNN
jgi:hypothetical protein